MAGHDSGSRAPTDGLGLPVAPRPDPDRTIEASRPAVAPADSAASLTAPRLGGGISLMVAFLGLVGSAIGAAFFGLEGRLTLNPGGYLGAALVVVAAILLVIGLIL